MDKALVRHLGEAGCGEETGRIGFLDRMAGFDDSVPAGVVLTREFHRRFLDTLGFTAAIRASAGGRGGAWRRVRALRREYGQVPLNDELNRMICDVTIGLAARTVAVISEDVTLAGLRTIPEVRGAVRKAWLSRDGLKRQIEAVSLGERIPTWPVVILRESRPESGTRLMTPG